MKIDENDGRRLVHVCGELDLAARDEFYNTCVTGDHSALVIDMSRLTFLDCSGYGALVAVRLAIQGRGGSVIVRRPMGQPAHLLALLAEKDSQPSNELTKREKGELP